MQQRHIVTALACFVLIAAPPAQAQDEELPPVWPGFIAPAKEHVARRLPQIQALAPLQEGVLFIGDSITEGAPLWAMFPGLPSANYGIGWDTTDGLLLRLDQVRRNVAERAFILIGTNDLGYQHSARHIASNIQSIVAELLPDMTNKIIKRNITTFLLMSASQSKICMYLSLIFSICISESIAS
jgi:lysophospholipase L1-like esterase